MHVSFHRLNLKCGPGFPWQNRVFLRQIWNGFSLLWQSYLCVSQSTRTVAPPERTGFWWYIQNFFHALNHGLCSKGPQRFVGWGGDGSDRRTDKSCFNTVKSVTVRISACSQCTMVEKWSSVSGGSGSAFQRKSIWVRLWQIECARWRPAWAEGKEGILVRGNGRLTLSVVPVFRAPGEGGLRRSVGEEAPWHISSVHDSLFSVFKVSSSWLFSS